MSSSGVVGAAGADLREQPIARVRGARQPIVVLVAVLVALNIADLVTTRLVIDRGGVEGNPLMRPFVEGVWGAAAIKLACLTLIAVLAARCLGSVRVRRGLLLVDAWYVVVVAWNLAILARA
jgi:hypothetical protein